MENKHFCLRKLGSERALMDNAFHHSVPNRIRDSGGVVGVRKGMIAFFLCFDGQRPPDGHKSSNKWRFWNVPSGVKIVRFPDFCSRQNQGFQYGNPVFS